jgi:hypothetical protein
MLLMKFAFPRHRGMRFPALVTALLIASGQALAQTPAPASQEFHATYPLAPGKVVGIHNAFGNVKVIAWDRSDVKLDAVKRAAKPADLTSAEIISDTDSEGLCIATKYAAAAHPSVKEWFGFKTDFCREPQKISGDPANLATFDYQVWVPRNANTLILVTQGDVEVEGLANRLYVDIGKGHLTARDISGECTLFGSYSGVNVTLTRLARDTHFTTAVGPLTVYLAPEISARVRAHSNSRAVFNDFGWQHKPREDLQGQLGSGGPMLDLTNFTGRVEIRRLPPPPAPPKPPVPARRKTTQR